MLRLLARWVLPVTSAPIPHGAVLVGEDGRIAAVGPDAAVPRPEGADAQDLGEAALLPGLVNTHTHLELMALRGLVRDRPFPHWITTIRRLKEGLGADAFHYAARWGVLEGFAAGITCIGDTGSTGEPARAMAELGARGVAYHEVFGPDPAHCDAAMTWLRTALAGLDRFASDRVVIGVSPHAPYTVSEPLLRAVCDLARDDVRRVAMHVAESQEERLFVEEGRGPFADHLRGRGIAVRTQGVSPIAWALRGGLEGVEPLLIHCVHAAEADLRAVARAHGAIAHCPLSNAALDNGRADLGLMKSCGVKVGIGTDSVAAGDSLDLFAAARFASIAFPMTPRELLRLITAGAADALGMSGAGRLEPGAWGDLCAVSLKGPGFAAFGDPEGAVAGGAEPTSVRATWVAGRLVYADGRWPGVDAQHERSQVERAVAAAVRVRSTLAARGVHPLSS
jgi:5-methylthioadenosine/S-adenosylhomocysteine deaminase